MSMLDYIGNTPYVLLNGVWCKCEQLNPTGSIKDRIALRMITRAKSEERIIEVSSGNTGVSVAFVCACLNLECSIVVPENTSAGKIELMSRYGADVVLVDGTLSDCIEHANTIKGTLLNQFQNKHNMWAHYITAAELPHPPDILVTGVGTAGTLAGFFRRFPNTRYYTPICKDHRIEGTSDGVPLPLKPKLCSLIEYPVKWTNVLSIRKYMANRGMFVGYSSAANYLVAKLLKQNHKSLSAAAIMADGGLRYEL